MAIKLHPGIGEKFSYGKRKWVVYDLREGIYTCKSIDNKKKPEETRTFTSGEIMKIFKIY